MSFKIDLETKLKEKGLTDSSIKLYIRNLEKLNEDLPLKNFKFLENIEAIENKLEKYKPNTKRGYLISIVSSLSTDKETKKIVKLHKTYYDKMMTLNTTIKETPTDEMSKQQSENWITWEEVINVYKQLKKEVEQFVNNKVISGSQYNTLLSLMVLSLYVFCQRRNKDFSLMNIVRPYDSSITDVNFLDYDNQKFIFNVYKTSKTHSQKIIDIPDELQIIIMYYLRHHPVLGKKKLPKKFNENFLMFENGNGFTAENTITRILNKIFGKKISSSMLYHIFVSNKFGDTVQKMEEVADNRGHTVQTLKEYIKKE
jgi:integrase